MITDTVERYVEGVVLAEIDGVAKLVPDSSERDHVIDRLNQARADLDDFRRDRAARRKLGADWHDWLDDYLAAVREKEAELERIDQRAGVASEGLTAELYERLSIDERREVLAGFIDCVFVRPSRGRGRHVDPVEHRVRVLWRGQAPADLPRRRVVNPIVSYDFEHNVEAGISATQDRA